MIYEAPKFPCSAVPNGMDGNAIPQRLCQAGNGPGDWEMLVILA